MVIVDRKNDGLRKKERKKRPDKKQKGLRITDNNANRGCNLYTDHYFDYNRHSLWALRKKQKGKYRCFKSYR